MKEAAMLRAEGKLVIDEDGRFSKEESSSPCGQSTITARAGASLISSTRPGASRRQMPQAAIVLDL